MKNLLPLDDERVETLNQKIKTYLEEGTITFTLDDDGKLVAMGHFAGGSDTIGDDEYSLLDWYDFIKYS